MKTFPEKRILLVFTPTDTGLAVQNHAGIIRYAALSKHWVFLTTDPGSSQLEPTIKNWNPHGIIGRLGRQDLTDRILKFHKPVVNLYGGSPFGPLPQIGTSDQAIGKMAAEYLLRLGIPHFAFYGLPEPPEGGFSRERQNSFTETLEKLGFRVDVFDNSVSYPKLKKELPPIMFNESQVHRWLARLPKPCALFSCCDMTARWISVSCQRLGLHIGRDIALLGCENNHQLRMLAQPRFSSIVIPGIQEGYEGAALLDRLMNGGKPPASPILLQPVEVDVAESTDLMSLQDPQLSHALKLIQQHACKRITIQQLAKQVGMSPRLLELRFKKTLKTSPSLEIRRTQMEQAKRLLRESHETLDIIADRCGFNSRVRFNLAFKQAVGVPPGIYRRNQQTG